MSYFCFDTNKNLISEHKENMTMNETPRNVENKKRDHRGELNPHFGHIMSQESRDKISATQKNRYEMINKLVRRGMHQMTEEKVKEIILNNVISEDRVREMIDESAITKEQIAEICSRALNAYLEKKATIVNNQRPMNINL